MNCQTEFQFELSGPAEAYSQWHARRQAIVEALGRRLSLPEGRLVEAWLRDGVREQTEIRFELSAPAEGYSQWVARRRAMAEDLGHKLCLPVGHLVEVWLRGGVRLRGRLRLQQDFLVVEEDQVRRLVLVVDGVPFGYGDIESCVRQD